MADARNRAGLLKSSKLLGSFVEVNGLFRLLTVRGYYKRVRRRSKILRPTGRYAASVAMLNRAKHVGWLGCGLCALAALVNACSDGSDQLGGVTGTPGTGASNPGGGASGSVSGGSVTGGNTNSG